MKKYSYIFATLLSAIVACSMLVKITNATPSILQPLQGGTGIGSATTTDFGKYLQVVSTTTYPYWKYQFSAASGTVSGNSTSGYVTFWSASSTIEGDGSLFWDNTNKFLGIGTSTPTGILTIGAATSTIYTDLLINPAAKNAGNLIDAKVGGVSRFSVTNTGSLTAVAVYASSGFFWNATTLNTNVLRNAVSGSRTGDGYLSAITGAGARTNTSGNQQFFAILPSYNQSSGTAANTDLFINRTETAVGSGAQYLIDAQVGGVSKFSVSNTGLVTAASNIISSGNIGVGTTTPRYDLGVTKTSSTTAIIGDNGVSGCLILGNSDGSAGLNYITALNGVLTATTTKPINCK